MRTHVTLLSPPARGKRSSPGISSVLPGDLFDQVRGRLRLLAGFFVIAFGVDLVVFTGAWFVASISGRPLPEEVWVTRWSQWGNLGAVIASGGLWWVARDARITPSRLHLLGLVYQVAICFVISISTYWSFYLTHQLLPNMTWVPAVVIMFPLILPGPPRRMLAAALVAAATGPVALTLLDVTHQIPVDIDSYVQATIGPLVAAGFAYMAASVVYGLGREVAAARELGSYQLVERLGEGGMGEVWRARHHMLARPAAIKLIRPVLVDGAPQPVTEHMVARFEREAQALASLRSPHTVDLFDFGVADDGSFYYAMELLEGLDTEVLVRRFGPVPAERAIHVLRQVCHSLSEAEARGLVHRDIKPANIFLCRYGEDYDFVKVLDFGIVKSTHGGGMRTPALTRETTVAGSPAFIAPEQAMGDRTVDGRADIYAIGCVGYWLLTGQFVFSADNAMSHLMHHINTPPAAPSTRTEMPIPPALEGLLLSCLAKSPNDRPQSAKQLVRALDQVVTAEPWTDDRARAWWAEHPMGHG